MLLNLYPKGDEWAKKLGTTCDIRDLVDAVAISGDFSEPTVVTTGAGACNVTRIDLTAEKGVAVPVVPTPTPVVPPPTPK